MKKIKFLILFLCLGAMLLVPVLIRPSESEGAPVMPMNMHTLHTVTSFSFIDHHACVNVDFMGYEQTAELRVDVRIEKQNFMLFRETVVSESYFSQGESYHHEFFYPIDTDGVYVCTVTYTVTNGEEHDLIEFKDTRTYLRADHTEHTHVWNRERVDPTCAAEGFEKSFCYCGEARITTLEKLPHNYRYGTSGIFLYEIDNRSCYAVYCTDCDASTHYYVYENTASTNSSNAASLNQPFNGFSGYQNQQCNCPFCKLERSIPDPTPSHPKTPSVPTVDPWKKQQEAYEQRNSNYWNPYHINNSYLFK